MPAAAPTLKTLTVALVGNPNTGKSTLFTALAGVRQRIGNYPGVTVEKKIGHAEIGGRRCALVDLPGTYSLAPRSRDEMVTVDVLLGRRGDVAPPDAVLCIVDASNLERNLYLVSQVLELGLPTVVVLNMIDVAAERGMKTDVGQLSARLGVPVVEVQANRQIGMERLKSVLGEAAGKPVSPRSSPLPPDFQMESASLAKLLVEHQPQLDGHNGNPYDSPNGSRAGWPRYLVDRLLLDTSGYLEELVAIDAAGRVQAEIAAARDRLAQAGRPVPAVEAMARYEWIGRILDGVVQRPRQRSTTPTDHIDRILTHWLWGVLIFAALMFAVFSSIFIAAPPIMNVIDTCFDWLGKFVASSMPEGALQSLLSKGVIGGVGSVLVFLPQILILFAFIGILEDCGYMARAAYLMDRLMAPVGLSGKSFIPLLSSFACAIPGVMATRVIENRRDRLTTILVAPLMSCSARLPVYTLLIAAFIPARHGLQGLTLFAMYLIGIITAAIVALLLKRTLLRGATPPFVMELPPYKIPSAKLVLHRMLERGWSFIYRAGTLIVAVAIVVWALLYYPHNAATVAADLQAQETAIRTQLKDGDSSLSPERRARLEEELARFSNPDWRTKLEAGAYQRHSVLGQMGRAIEPVVRPLGWDWRLGCAAIASFPAREVVLGTLGVIYNLGEDVDIHDTEGQTMLGRELHAATWDGTDRPVFNVPVALSLMVFFALCAQCAATLAVIKRETNSWLWPAFTFTYMTVLAYIGAFATYQIGMWIS